ncbi:hypothetical protein B0H14DRAFT_1185342 [Mycena olivaceomarginata]|nr:hypothetical protein B0H14DRAFT_1185342 [Mycena olivaceomarginata]
MSYRGTNHAIGATGANFLLLSSANKCLLTQNIGGFRLAVHIYGPPGLGNPMTPLSASGQSHRGISCVGVRAANPADRPRQRLRGINVPPSELNATKRSTYTTPLQKNHPMSSTTSSSRPSFVRSKTMPAFRRAILLPSVDKALGSLLASSSKGIRRIFSFSRSSTSSASVLKACPSTCSVPAFTMPDYTISTTAPPPPPPISVSPLTRPSFKRAMTMPAPMRVLRRIPHLIPAPKVCSVRRK